MARYAVIRRDGTVVNIAEWDGTEPWRPPDGETVELSNAGIGDIRGADGKFTRPTIAPPSPTRREQLRAKLIRGNDLTPSELQEAIKLLL